MTDLSLLYCPFPTHAAAIHAARLLVAERKVACCNLLPAVTSFYCWEGQMMESSEWVLLAKTTHAHSHAAMVRMGTLHPYENPAILVVKLADAPPAFRAWVQAQTDIPTDEKDNAI